MRVEIKKEMDELHKSISNGGTISQECKTVHRAMGTGKMKTTVFNSGATSNCGMVGDDFILTKKNLTKSFTCQQEQKRQTLSKQNSTIE